MVSNNKHNNISIKSLVNSEIDKINNPIVKNALQNIIVEPVQHLRKWDYGHNDEKFICWTIAIDKDSDTALVYSDYGFGPETPWGLVSESINYFGMDTGWFDNLKDCFLNSNIASKLPIWNVEKKINNLTINTIADKLTLNEALEKRDDLALIDCNFIYNVIDSDK